MKGLKNTILLVILASFFNKNKAQVGTCQTNKSAQTAASIYYSAENLRSDTINILKYTVNVDITDFVKDTIRGNCTVKFTPKMNAQNKIRLDLLKMFVDSIKLASTKLTFTYNDTVIKVNLPMSYNSTDTVDITVFYHGKPQGDPSGWGGFYFNGNYAFNLGVGFGAKPHNYGRVWFPCFDNFVEKSVYEFNITTDTSKKAFCNGQLMSDVKVGNKRTRQWMMNKEIPSYLASVAVADYTQVNWSTPVMTGTVPIVLTARAVDTTAMKSGFVNLKTAIAGFENYYGPFVWNRVGYCLVPFNNGAMEHATNISYPQVAAGSLAYEADIMAHELSHHWWGDLMTCETQEDMWLNEGMASYSERLFKEYKYNYGQYIADVKSEHEYLLHYAHFKETQYRAVSGIPFQYTYGDHVYKKGADVAHTLRTYLGDTDFFNGLKYVLTQKAYKNMNSAEFKSLLETATGKPLADFFNNWVFAGGWPHFSLDSIKYAAIGGGNYSANVFIKQKLTGAPTLYNNVPIEVTFFDNSWVKTVKQFTVSGANSAFTTTLSFNPRYAAINLDSKISDAISSETKVVKVATTYNMTTLVKAVMQVTSAGIDSSFIRIEHNYCAPDPIKNNIKNYKLNTQHYWKVDGIMCPGFLSKFQIHYDGNPVPTTSVSTGLYAYLDTCLASINADSIIVVYRKNAADDWRIVSKYSRIVTALRTGIITVDTLKFGEYAFANKQGIPLGIKNTEIRESVLKVFPNPASNSVTFRTENYDLLGGEVIEIRNIEGKLVHTQLLKGKETVWDCAGFAKGTYFTTLQRQGKIVSKEKLILQ
jgi:hypothetical protein